MLNSAITVEIWSDIACPWCYIATAQFDIAVDHFVTARAERGEAVPAIEVVLRSFELRPDAATDFTIDDLCRQTGVPVSEAARYSTLLAERGADVGLTIRFDDVQYTNTALAHQALHFAKHVGKQHDLHRRLMSAHFTEGKHVGRVEDVADLAAEVGLDHDEVLAALNEERYLADVRDDEAAARRAGITSVPSFVANGRYLVSGAQPEDAFIALLDAAAESPADQYR